MNLATIVVGFWYKLLKQLTLPLKTPPMTATCLSRWRLSTTTKFFPPASTLLPPSLTLTSFALSLAGYPLMSYEKLSIVRHNMGVFLLGRTLSGLSSQPIPLSTFIVGMKILPVISFILMNQRLIMARSQQSFLLAHLVWLLMSTVSKPTANSSTRWKIRSQLEVLLTALLVIELRRKLARLPRTSFVPCSLAVGKASPTNSNKILLSAASRRSKVCATRFLIELVLMLVCGYFALTMCALY
jgi:hypothetical protein